MVNPSRPAFLVVIRRISRDRTITSYLPRVLVERRAVVFFVFRPVVFALVDRFVVRFLVAIFQAPGRALSPVWFFLARPAKENPRPALARLRAARATRRDSFPQVLPKCKRSLVPTDRADFTVFGHLLWITQVRELNRFTDFSSRRLARNATMELH